MFGRVLQLKPTVPQASQESHNIETGTKKLDGSILQESLCLETVKFEEESDSCASTAGVYNSTQRLQYQASRQQAAHVQHSLLKTFEVEQPLQCPVQWAVHHRTLECICLAPCL